MVATKAEVEESIRRLEELDDDAGLAEAYSLLGTLLTWTGSIAGSMEVLDRSASLARQAGVETIASRSLTWLLVGSLWGPMPVAEGLALCKRVASESNRYIEGFSNIVEGSLRSMAGELELGEALTAKGRSVLEELGHHVTVSSTRMASARRLLFSGHPRESEDELRRGYAMLEQMGERGYLSTIAAILAVTLCALDRYDEAEHYIREARKLGAKDDITTQLYWRCAQAEVLASRGETKEALQVIQEGQDLIDATDYIVDRAAALTSRAVVEKAAGDPDGARVALQSAVELLEEKGDVTAAAHTRKLIEELKF
jgi:tetratricopeptide (TPR) repeat protein